MRNSENFQFAVLGPLEVRQGRQTVSVRGWREHVVLAMLVLANGGVVTMARLVQAVWDDAPPPGAVKAVRNCVSAVRRRHTRAGGPGVPIETATAGYRLSLDDCYIDARDFRQQADAARLLAAGYPAEAAARLRSALSLWRGPALAGIESTIMEAGTARLNEQRMTVLEECLDLELALGQHRRAVSELRALASEYPLREKITAQLMLALYRSGRQADALGTYRHLAGQLAGELGIDPAGETTRLHEAILRHDPTLDLGQTALPHRPGSSYEILPGVTCYRARARSRRPAWSTGHATR